MPLLDKLNPVNLELLLSNQEESPTNYLRAIKALTENDSYWDLSLNEIVTIIRMAELEDCAVGMSNFINYFKND
tara:strand:- start:359 stop:580 length:222 start_codon:yes stop_codon:yes gene_type:complete